MPDRTTKADADAGTDIAVRPNSEAASKYLAIRRGVDSVIDTIETNLGGERITPSDLSRIKMGSGGLAQWLVESPDGEDVAKTVTGIPILMKLTRSYWPGEYTGAKTPPQCWSDDNKVGYGDPGGSHPEQKAGLPAPYDCTTCPNAQFGSDGGRGQACKLMRVVFLLKEGKLLPDVVILPPTSVGIMRKFLMNLASEDLSYHQVVVELGLKQTANQEGIKYAELVPRRVEVLSDEQTMSIKRLAEALKPNLERIRVDADQQAAGAVGVGTVVDAAARPVEGEPDGSAPN